MMTRTCLQPRSRGGSRQKMAPLQCRCKRQAFAIFNISFGLECQA